MEKLRLREVTELGLKPRKTGCITEGGRLGVAQGAWGFPGSCSVSPRERAVTFPGHLGTKFNFLPGGFSFLPTCRTLSISHFPFTSLRTQSVRPAQPSLQAHFLFRVRGSEEERGEEGYPQQAFQESKLFSRLGKATVGWVGISTAGGRVWWVKGGDPSVLSTPSKDANILTTRASDSAQRRVSK